MNSVKYFLFLVLSSLTQQNQAQDVYLDSVILDFSETTRQLDLHRTVQMDRERHLFIYFRDANGTYVELRDQKLDTISGGMTYYNDYYFWDFLKTDEGLYVFAQAMGPECDDIQNCIKSEFYLLKLDREGEIILKERVWIDINNQQDQCQETFGFTQGFLVADGLQEIHIYFNIPGSTPDGAYQAQYFHAVHGIDGKRIGRRAHFGKGHLLAADVEDGVRFEVVTERTSDMQESVSYKVFKDEVLKREHLLANGLEFYWGRIIQDAYDGTIALHGTSLMTKKGSYTEKIWLFSTNEDGLEKKKNWFRSKEKSFADFNMTRLPNSDNLMVSFTQTQRDYLPVDESTVWKTKVIDPKNLKTVKSLDDWKFQIEDGVRWSGIGFLYHSQGYLRWPAEESSAVKMFSVEFPDPAPSSSFSPF